MHRVRSRSFVKNRKTKKLVLKDPQSVSLRLTLVGIGATVRMRFRDDSFSFASVAGLYNRFPPGRFRSNFFLVFAAFFAERERDAAKRLLTALRP